MVKEVGSSTHLVARAHLPTRPQPWEGAMVLIGLPGATLSAVATCGLAVVGATTDPLVGLGGIATVLVVYLTTMGLLWAGTSAELG